MLKIILINFITPPSPLSDLTSNKIMQQFIGYFGHRDFELVVAGQRNKFSDFKV